MTCSNETATRSDKVVINVIYGHFSPEHTFSMSRGNVSVIHTGRPVSGCAMYVYMDAFSFYGRQKGLNVLFITEPTIVLPGQYNESIWNQFDHVVTLCDELVERYGFAKGYSPRQGFHPWFGESKDFVITENLDERIRKYPLKGRRQAICMISGNKRSLVPGELYSRRIEAALWFHTNSDIPFDVYGMTPYFLPSYKGPVENNTKLTTLSSYRFTLCFENSRDPVFARGWVDKILDSLEARTVPIYLGCPNIEEYIPKTCFIDLRDFSGYEELDKYLRTISESEYARYIDNIDDWVSKGGLRLFSWYRLYDDLVKYYAGRTRLDCESLCDGESTWQMALAPRTVDFVEASPVWTFEEHQKTPSPLINYEETPGGLKFEPGREYLRRAVKFAKEGRYPEAVKEMGWLPFYRNSDLFWFYAQLLHVLGYVQSEAVYLGLALQLNPNHALTLKQLDSSCFDNKAFEKMMVHFETMINNQKIEAVPGLTSIIIPVSAFNDNTRQCVESIRAHVSEPYEMILIKSGSSKTPEWLKKLMAGNLRCKIMGAPKNAGYAANCNAAIKKASGQYILILEANTVMLKGSFSEMLEQMRRYPKHGIIVPMSNRALGPQQIPGTERLSFKAFEEYAKRFNERNRHRCVVTFEADWICALTKRSLLDTIGPFNEEIKVPYFVVNDYRMRALAQGEQTAIAAASCIYLSHDGPRTKGFQRLFHEKWSRFNPHSETGQKLLPFLAIKNARDNYGKGLLNEAIQAIMDGIKYTPENEDLYYCLADILFDNKQYEQSIEAIESLPEKERNTAKALEMLGYCNYHLGHFQKALEYAEHVSSLSADSARAVNLKGLLALHQGERDKAGALFKQATAVDPAYADPYMRMGVIKWQNNEGKEALDLIEKGFILSPETEDFSTTYNSAVTLLKEFPRAETVFLEACRLFPVNKKLVFLYIGILLQQGKYAEAMEDTQKAVAAFGVDDGILAAALQIRTKLGPLKVDETRRKGSLSVCMIVKNEEKQIARCLMSLVPVASEIIVVDTGSTDRTRDIARVFGAQIHDFEWSGDFSEARNVSLEKAAGEWVLVHDADEVLSPLDHDKLRDITSRTPSKPLAYVLTTRNYITEPNVDQWTGNIGEYAKEEAGSGWFPSGKVRLFVNDKRIRFRNPVHELLEPSINEAGVTMLRCDIPIHHYGKLPSENTAKKSKLYYELGKKKLALLKNSPAAVRELAIQAAELQEYDESIEFWKQYLCLRA